MLKTVQNFGPLLHGLCAPFLKLKIELTKLQAANWNTLMGLLSLAITNLRKVDLLNIWKWIKMKCYFKRQSWKMNNTVTRYVFIHLKKINH